MAITLDGSAGITTPGETITGTGSKITGDFTNATVASRNSFQTSTTNGSTGIYALPNGSSTAASWQATNAADPTNASKILIATNGSTDVQLVSGINGSGTYLPMSFYTNGTQQMQLSTAGILTGTAGNLMLVQGTAQNLTSGTTAAFTSIPSWVKRITVSVTNLTGSGSSPNIIQLGTGAGPTYTTTGYLASATVVTTAAATTAFTTGFPLVQSQTSSYVKSGVGVLTLVDAATNTWAWSGTFAFSTGSTGTYQAGGYIALSGVLTALQLTTVNGTDTFVSGKVNIQYE